MFQVLCSFLIIRRASSNRLSTETILWLKSLVKAKYMPQSGNGYEKAAHSLCSFCHDLLQL